MGDWESEIPKLEHRHKAKADRDTWKAIYDDLFSKSSLATRANTWTVAQIVREFGVSRSVIARYEKEGIFPKPVEWNPHLGTKTYLRYDRQEVAELMETYTEYKKTDAVELKIKLTQDEIDSIRLAARKVYLHPDRYMSEVL